MIIDKRNNNFSNIGTVVFYRTPENFRFKFKFLPDNLGDIPSEFRGIKSDLVKYHGSTDNFPGINFAEYDFSYIPYKDKFDNSMFLTELDRESGELIGKNIEDTDKIGKVLFPTLVDEETDNPYKYFGSLDISGRRLYFFECPEDYYCIEIYEDVIESNTEGGDGFIEYRYLELSGQTEGAIEPAIIITLGPVREAYNNPTEFYYNNDPYKSRSMRTDLEYTTLEYSRLCDEIFSKKVICFFLSTNNDVTDFNLSFAAWNNNDNPARNKWKYDLRNDEFYDFYKNETVVRDAGGGLWEDKKAGTILGNSEIPTNQCPIKDKKLNRLERTQENYYSPYRRYSKGDTTIYKVLHSNGTYSTYTLESLVSGNIGNDPLLSPAWILKDKFLDFITDIIYISFNPAGNGSTVDPGTQITVHGDSNISFFISEGIGYLFSGLSIIDSNNETIDLVEGEDYTYTLLDTDTDYIKTVDIDGWSDYIDPESEKYTHNLVFNFEERPSILKILAKRGGTVYHYEDWTSEFGDGFGMTLKLNGEVVPEPEPGSDISPISYEDGDMYLFIDNPEQNYTLEIDFTGDLIKRNIESKYRIGNRKYTKTIEINNNIATDVIDFADSEYTINLDSIERYISVRADRRTVRCENVGLFTIDLGSDYTIPFELIGGNASRRISISLVNFWYDDNNRLIKYDNELLINSSPYNGQLILDGNTTADISLTQEETGTYYLSLSNITENIIVQISGTN